MCIDKARTRSSLCTLTVQAEPFPWQAHGNQEEDDNNESPSTPLFRWLLRAALARQAWAWGVVRAPMLLLSLLLPHLVAVGFP
eukprot:1159429-Pelagomonas_calceolata.AAC.5